MIVQEEEITEMTADLHHAVMILIIPETIITTEDILLIDIMIEGMTGPQDRMNVPVLLVIEVVLLVIDLVHQVMVVQIHQDIALLIEMSVNYEKRIKFSN